MVQATFLAGSDVSLEGGCLHKSASERGKPKTTEGDETETWLLGCPPSLAGIPLRCLGFPSLAPSRNVAWTITSVPYRESECLLAHAYYTPHYERDGSLIKTYSLVLSPNIIISSE